MAFSLVFIATVLLLQVSLLNAQPTLNIDSKDVFGTGALTEVVSVFFSNDGYTVSGRKVTRNNVHFQTGLTQETGFRNGGLNFGRGTTGFFSVDGIDMRDPLNFINCPAGTKAGFETFRIRLDGGAPSVCCINPDGICADIGNTDGEMTVPNMGLMVRMRINFGSFSKICVTCDDVSGGEDDYPWSTTCTGAVGELSVSSTETQTIFSVPVEGSPNNFKLTIKREQIFASEHNNGCNLSQLYYTFSLTFSDIVVGTWTVYKYHKLWLEDGNDHTFTLIIPRLPEFQIAGKPAYPLLYIDGQYICFSTGPKIISGGGPKVPVTTGEVAIDPRTIIIRLGGNIIHCLDKRAEGVPSPVLPQEITNQKCSLTRLYLGNAPSTWDQETLGASGQASNFRSYTGLQGATFKSFQMWNYQGIPEPANTRLCGEKNSAQCSFYTKAPFCKGPPSIEWASLVLPPQEKTGCPVTTPPRCFNMKGLGTRVGTSSDCKFIGDKCPADKACRAPGVCVSFGW